MAAGALAVFFYALGYLQKERKNIIFLNLTSRILYILQYLLLGAFEGAVLDVMGALSSVFAGRKNNSFIKRNTKLFVLFFDVLIVLSGLLVYENLYSLLPIAGVLLHTSAFWIDDEKTIRRVSFLGSPFWLVYNFISQAYPSCVGDILSMVSLGISMVRYDFKKSLKN